MYPIDKLFLCDEATIMDLTTAIVTLFFVMDPLGNIPLFLSTLKQIPEQRRAYIIWRELIIAYVILCAFVVGGAEIMHLFGLSNASLRLSGGLVLLMISFRMVFPPLMRPNHEEKLKGVEPMIVPLATPLIAGPSTIATILFLVNSKTLSSTAVWGAMSGAWILTAIILRYSGVFYRILKENGIAAMERLMGMLLTTVAVQMMLDGLKEWLQK